MPTTNVGKNKNQGGLCDGAYPAAVRELNSADISLAARASQVVVGEAAAAVGNVTQAMNSGGEPDQNLSALGFSELPTELVANHIVLGLKIRDIGTLSQTSKKLREDVRSALEDAKKQVQDLEIKLKQLITSSGITGIQIPEGPFNHSIHKLSVLTAFEDAFPNAIAVLNRNDITDINARYEDGDTPLLWANKNGFKEIA